MEVFHQIFGSAPPSITWWQMCARAALIFVYAIALLRLGARRALGRGAAMDIVVAVVVGSALSRALTGTVDLLGALAATALLFALHSLAAMIAARSTWFSRLMNGDSTTLVENREVNWRRAHRALIGETDLDEELRLHGLSDPGPVKCARLERNGKISVVKARNQEAPISRPRSG